MADEVLDVLINVDDSDIDSAVAKSKLLENALKKDFNTKIKVDTSSISAGESALGRMSSGAAKVSNVLQGVSNNLNVVSAAMQNIGNNMQMVGRFGLIGSTLLGGAGLAGLASITKTGISAASSLENVQNQIRAQGIDDAKVAEVMQYIRTYANQSAFSVNNLGDALSSVNSYVGDIDQSKRAVEVFGTSLMATGKNAEDLARVAPNLGQLFTGSFTKTDYKELVRGVPAISQALRDIDISSWEDFTAALGDNPDTKAIEITGNALELVTNALDKFNVKTDAFAKSQESLSAKWENFQGIFEDNLAQAANDSGLYEKLGTMMDNLGTGIERNLPLITKFYGKLGDLGVSLSEKFANFDFEKFFTGFKNSINDISESISNFVDKNGETIGKIKDYFTAGKQGAEGFGNALGNIFGTSVKLYFGGTAVKALASVVSLLSAGAGVAANFSKGLSSVFSSLDKVNQKSNIATNTGILSQLKNKKANKSSATGSALYDSFSSMLPVTALNNGLNAIQGDVAKVFKANDKKLMNTIMVGANGTAATITKSSGKFKTIVNSASKGFSSVGTAVSSKLKSGIRFVGQNLMGIGTDILLITQAVKQFDELPSASAVTSGFAKVAAVMTGMSLLNTFTGKISQFAKVDQMVGALGNVLNAGSMVVVAKSLSALENLPETSVIGVGFAKVAAVATGMTLLNSVIGGIGLSLGGLPAVANAIGALSNILNAGSILALTKAIKSLDGLPDADTINTAMGKLMQVAASMGLVATTSAFLNLGGISAVVASFSTWNNAKMTEHIVEIAKSLNELNNINVPTNATDKVTRILAVMESVAASVSANPFPSLGKKWNTGNLDGMMDNIVSSAKSLEKINDIDVPTTSSTKVQRIMTAVKSISSEVSGNVFDSLSSLGKKWNSGNLKTVIDNVVEAGKLLSNLNQVEVPETVGGINKKISSIMIAIKSLTNQVDGDIFSQLTALDKKWTSNSLSKIVTNISSAATALSGLSDANVPDESAITKITNSIKKAVSSLEGFTIDSNVSTMSENLSKAVEGFGSAANSLNSLNDIQVPSATTIGLLTQSIEQVQQALKKLASIQGDDSVSGAKLDQAASLQEYSSSISDIIAQLATISGNLQSLQSGALNAQQLAEQTKVTIDGMMNALTMLKSALNVGRSGTVSSLTDSMGFMTPIEGTSAKAAQTPTFGEDTLTEIDSLLEKINEIASKLATLSSTLATLQQAAVNVDMVKSQLEQIKRSLGSLNAFLTGGLVTEGGASGDVVGAMGESLEDNVISKSIEKIKAVAEQVKQLQSVLADIQAAKVAADQVQQAMTQLIASLKNILTSFNAEGGLNEIGGQVGSDAITTAINNIKSFVERVRSSIQEIGTIAPLASTNGTNLGNAVVQGFTSVDFSQMKTPVQTVLDSIGALGQPAGAALSSGFNSGSAGMSNTAVSEVEKIKSAIASIPTSINVSVNVSTNAGSIASQIDSLKAKAAAASTGGLITPAGVFSKGGQVARFADGGIVGRLPYQSNAYGTDKIPAMLTNGEFVQQRKSVAFWGRGMMDAINKRNVGRVHQLMQSKLSRTTSKITNTTTTNNNPVVNQTFYGGSSKQYLGIAKMVRGV